MTYYKDGNGKSLIQPDKRKLKGNEETLTVKEFGKLIEIEQRDLLLEPKRQECSETIFSKMSDQKQKNLNQDVNRISIKINLENREPSEDEMKLLTESEAFILFRDEVLTEFRTNRENADFTRFK